MAHTCTPAVSPSSAGPGAAAARPSLRSEARHSGARPGPPPLLVPPEAGSGVRDLPPLPIFLESTTRRRRSMSSRATGCRRRLKETEREEVRMERFRDTPRTFWLPERRRRRGIAAEGAT